MAVYFAVRSDSMTARYSMFSKTYAYLKTNAGISLPSIDVDATAIGGNCINCNAGTNNYKIFGYQGKNFPSTNNSFSLLMRVKFAADTIDCGLFTTGGFPFVYNGAAGHINFYYQGSSSDKFHVILCNEYNTALYAAAPGSGTFVPTVGQWYDVVLTYDGTATTNAIKVYLDGALFGAGNASAAYSASALDRQPDFLTLIFGGSQHGSSSFAYSRVSINEIVIWNEVIDATANVTLTSGPGLLTGSTRTAFVDAAAYEGGYNTNPGIAKVEAGTTYYINGYSYTGTLGLSTDPGIANVRKNTSYSIMGVALTGTCAVPTSAETKIGVLVEDTTGTYDGTDRHTHPSENDVMAGIQWKDNSLTLNKTGLLNVIATYSTGTSNEVDLVGIEEQIKEICRFNNTTTSSVKDLSTNLVNRVNQIIEYNPGFIPPQASYFPLVAVYVDEKTIDQAKSTIAKDQVTARRMCNLNIKVLGAVWNTNISTNTEDPAAKDVRYLMENIEYLLRAYPTLNGAVNWQRPDSCIYHDVNLSENVHLRVGVLNVQAKVDY